MQGKNVELQGLVSSLEMQLRTAEANLEEEQVALIDKLKSLICSTADFS